MKTINTFEEAVEAAREILRLSIIDTVKILNEPELPIIREEDIPNGKRLTVVWRGGEELNQFDILRLDFKNN